MVSPSRTSSSPRQRDYAGKLFIGALILLGLVASIFLIFSDSLQFIRIGLVAALWAAVLGALAATKYRKESTVDKAKVRDLQTVYELQLDREISARREYELGVEARVRHEVGADATEMAALRAELTVLRQNLQRLFDGDLPTDRPALRADATRIQELTGRPAGSANGNSANADGWAGPQLPRDSVTPVYDTDHPQPPVFASPYDDPVTAETSIITLDRDDATTDGAGRTGERTEVFATTSGWADAFAETPAEPDDERPESTTTPWVASDSASTGKSPLVGPPAPAQSTESGSPGDSEVVGPPAPGASEPAASPARSTPAGPTFGSASSRRRRRAESESGESSSKRLSVAEILANLQSEESNGSR
ncbi:DUF6779 domain-containing protein [Nocardia sp. NPDC059180]|uniref:DUF6779 domain-containing protein n=1 Tax=Nocardia sp. NPDC059180 TaxID=3346761 RepID=UPI0036A48AC4